MIFYGSNSSRIKDGQINNVICPNCDTNTSMTYAIFGKYAYIYWVPLFPMGKENILECNNCHKTYNLNELSDTIKTKFEFEKQGAGIPIWYFSGIGVIALLIGLISYNSAQNSADNELYIQEPIIGDVYSLNIEGSSFYTTMKVSEVSADSVSVIYNDYEIDQKSGIDRIDKEKNYTDALDKYSKEELVFYFDEGFIYDIERD